jgi:hypothetical protein
MTTGKVIWPVYPYKAGLCITDDTDAATFEQVKVVYDFLSSRHFLTTKTVWPFMPSDKCGIPPTPVSTLRGITLQDRRYLEYCKELRSKGYEICLHGASAGNNPRESTKMAFEFLRKEIGHSDTFICHSKNADNIYWNDKITSLFPFKYLLRVISKCECSGEISTSPYFWGDLCHDNINQIRLYRTRCINTLRKNPSMPYHSPNRPFVNGWFSATKRSLSDCAQKEELEKLVEENGLTVLYQYLHRYGSPNGHDLNKRFVNAVESLTSNASIKIDTVSNIMNRLRMIQGIFYFSDQQFLWIVNTNQVIVESLQIVFDKPIQLRSTKCKIAIDNRTANIVNIPAMAIIKIESNTSIKIKGKRSFSAVGSKTICQHIANSKMYLNLTSSNWQVSNNLQIAPESFFFEPKRSGTNLSILSELPLIEETSLILSQIMIVAREILLKGRSLNSTKYLDDSKEIRLENHDNW